MISPLACGVGSAPLEERLPSRNSLLLSSRLSLLAQQRRPLSNSVYTLLNAVLYTHGDLQRGWLVGWLQLFYTPTAAEEFTCWLGSRACSVHCCPSSLLQLYCTILSTVHRTGTIELTTGIELFLTPYNLEPYS